MPATLPHGGLADVVDEYTGFAVARSKLHHGTQESIVFIQGDETVRDVLLQDIVQRPSEFRAIERQQLFGRVVRRAFEYDTGQLWRRIRSQRGAAPDQCGKHGGERDFERSLRLQRLLEEVSRP